MRTSLPARGNLLFVFLALAATGSSAILRGDATPPFYLHDGDRVVFYGDSITDQRLYTTDVETYVVTRFPKMQASFVASGWGGDRVSGGLGGTIDVRLQRDVIPYNPSVVTIMLGMNDGGYRPFEQGIYDAYTKGYLSILDTLSKALPDARFTLIEPSPYDEIANPARFPGGYNAVLLRFADFVKQTAAERHDTVADFNTPMCDLLQKAKEADPELAKKILPGSVHPSPAGHLVMAESLLEAWHAPDLVSRVVLDAASGRTVKADNTAIANFKNDKTLTWTETDNCLPFPIDMTDPLVSLVMKSSDFIKMLNQETLQVQGLTETSYTLAIDGTVVGKFTPAELADGINLASFPTPMEVQAKQVMALTVQHNDKHFLRWRTLQVPLSVDASPEVLQALAVILKVQDNQEQDIVKRQRAAAIPLPHQYTLTPITNGAA
jgi:lysophospholipase L1-like esterase